MLFFIVSKLQLLARAETINEFLHVKCDSVDALKFLVFFKCIQCREIMRNNDLNLFVYESILYENSSCTNSSYTMIFLTIAQSFRC